MIFYEFFTFSVNRTIYIIPEWRRYSENDLSIAVMMDTVVDPKLAEEIFRGSVNMNQVMNKEVASVSNQETGRERKSIVT